jgi:DNA polymerase I-like protein with 3'-5' exonuclease and polymerase domains
MLGIENPNKFDWENIPLATCANGNYADAHYTLQIYHILYEKMQELKMDKLYDNIISPAINEFADIEYQGIPVSTNKLQEVGKVLKDANIESEDFLYTCKGVQKTDNLSSNNNLIEIMYTREGGLELYPPDKTSKGSPSVSAPTLTILLDFINEELEARGKVEKS